MPIATPQGTLDFKSVDTVTFVGASSNTVIDTTTGSLGVGVDGNGPTSNLHVVGNAFVSSNLTVSGNATVSSNLTVSGNVEVSADTQVQEYPPRSLHQYITHVEGHGVFNVLASAELNQTADNDRAWKLFTKIADADNYWTPANGGYDVSTGNTTSASPSTDGTAGHWVQLELPYKIKLHSVKIAAGISNRQAKDATVFGSNDGGSTWTSVGGWTDNNVSDFSLVTFSMNNVGYYNLYRLVVTKNGGNAALTLSELQLLGTPAPTTLDKDSLSLSRSLDVPRISRYDVDTETPRPEKLLVDFDTTVNSSPTDISGQGNHGTMVGATYSAADKAFNFDASTEYIESTLNNTGDTDISVSLWLKREADTVGTAWMIGNPTQTNGQNLAFDIYPSSTNQIYLWTPDGPTLTDTDGGSQFPQNQWVHVVGTRTGATLKLYIDGVDWTPNTTYTAGGSGLSLPANSNFRLGLRMDDNIEFTGKISNSKVYDVVLEPSEVQKLYRLGRTGRSMIISDTAVGIGKAPEAQLDVRGVARLERLLINGTLGHVLLEEAEIYYDPSRAECQDRTEFMNNTVRDIKGNYDGTKTGISEYNQFWGQDADNSGIATNNNVDLRRDWTAMVWMKPNAADNLVGWRILGHGTTTSNGGLHFQGADGSRVRAGMYGNDIDVGTASGMSRTREWNCMTFAYYHNNGVAGGCDKMIYQNERLVGHQQAGIGDGYHFSGDGGGSGYQNGHQPYSASPNILRFGAGFSSGSSGKQYQHIGPCIFIPRFLSTQEVRSLYRFFAMRFARVGANN